MLTNTRKITGSLAATVAVLALGGLLEVAIAANAPASAAPAADHAMPPGHGAMRGPMNGRMGGMGMGGMEGPGMAILQAFHKLELSTAQRDKLQELVKAERESAMKSMKDGQPDLVALGDPGNPKHAAAIEAARKLAADRVQRAADLEQKAWELLTPEQKAWLPKVLESEQKRMQERREHPEGEAPAGREGPMAHGPMNHGPMEHGDGPAPQAGGTPRP